MKHKSFTQLLPIFVLLLTLGGLHFILPGSVVAQEPEPEGDISAQVAVGTAFTYQGRMSDTGGPVNGTCDLRFRLYTAASGGTLLGTDLVNGVPVSDGYFSVYLNDNGEFGANAFNGQARWLEIRVNCGSGDANLSPRQPLTAAPYALYALQTGGGGGAFWSLSGNSGTTNSNFLGTTDNQALEFKVNNTRALRLEYASDPFVGTSPNLIGGYSGNSVTPGVVGATIGGGGSSSYPNQVTASHYVTISGGEDNTAGSGGDHATVGGGGGNTASGGAATVGGGGGNTASGQFATVSGGLANIASGSSATISGGRENSASGDFSFAAGRRANANHNGTFVWADSTDADFASDRNDQFKVRASGGAWFQVSGSSGLNPPALRVESTSGNGVAIYVRQTSSDAALVVTNKGTGDLIKAFGTSAGGNLRFRVDQAGNVSADGTISGGGADFAEMVQPGQADLVPGDVLVVGPDGRMVRSSQAYQTSVVGVYSTEPGFLGGHNLDETGHPMNPERIPLAVVGIVPVKASTENGPIQPGDLLVTSATPGYAMRADLKPPTGTVLGKALEGLKADTGVIQMLVVLQ